MHLSRRNGIRAGQAGPNRAGPFRGRCRGSHFPGVNMRRRAASNNSSVHGPRRDRKMLGSCRRAARRAAVNLSNSYRFAALLRPVDRGNVGLFRRKRIR